MVPEDKPGASSGGIECLSPLAQLLPSAGGKRRKGRETKKRKGKERQTGGGPRREIEENHERAAGKEGVDALVWSIWHDR